MRKAPRPSRHALLVCVALGLIALTGCDIRWLTENDGHEMQKWRREHPGQSVNAGPTTRPQPAVTSRPAE